MATAITKQTRILVTGRNLQDLYPLLHEQGLTVVDCDPEFVIAYGGDGSLLGAEQRFPGIPKLALRDERSNPKCPQHHERDILAQLLNGELKPTELTKIAAETSRGFRLIGINDVVMSRQLVSSAIRYRIWLDDAVFREQVVADSLVVATPFGSTGYFQSITHGNFLTGFGIAFNNSMDLYGHTVVSAGTRIKVELLRGPAVLVADNNPELGQLETGDTITVQAADQHVLLYGLEAFRCIECYQRRKNGPSTNKTL